MSIGVFVYTIYGSTTAGNLARLVHGQLLKHNFCTGLISVEAYGFFIPHVAQGMSIKVGRYISHRTSKHSSADNTFHALTDVTSMLHTDASQQDKVEQR